MANNISSGEAELGIHQISEIVPAPGRNAGWPAAEGDPELVYSAGISAATKRTDVARALIAVLSRPFGAGAVRVQGYGRSGRVKALSARAMYAIRSMSSSRQIRGLPGKLCVTSAARSQPSTTKEATYD